MKFAQALVAMGKGKAVRRPSWSKDRHWFQRGSTIVSSGTETKEVTEVTIVNTMATDWEVYPDSPVKGYTETKTVWILRCVTRTGDAISLHVSKDSALDALADWCAKRWTRYLANNLLDAADRADHAKVARTYFCAAAAQDAAPDRATITEVDIPAQAPWLEVPDPVKPVRVRALDLGLDDDGKEEDDDEPF